MLIRPRFRKDAGSRARRKVGLYHLFILVSTMLFGLNACTTDSSGGLLQADRIFSSSFESIADFSAFYIVPQGDYDSDHELTKELVHDGEYSHKAWITAARAATNDGFVYRPHRAYPTIQLYKTAEGSFVTPCLISFWAYLDMTLADKPAGSIDDWFSFATLTPDTSDTWNRTVLVNIAPDGYLHLMHVPDQGEQEHIYQAAAANDGSGDLLYPYRQWVRIDVYLDLSADGGYAKVWQDGVLVSHARVDGGHGTLAQAHFGLYASAAVAAGTVYNDALSIREISDEAAALLLLITWLEER